MPAEKEPSTTTVAVTAKPVDLSPAKLPVNALGQTAILEDGTKVVIVKCEPLARLIHTLVRGHLSVSYQGVGGAMKFADMIGLPHEEHAARMQKLTDFTTANIPK